MDSNPNDPTGYQTVPPPAGGPSYPPPGSVPPAGPGMTDNTVAAIGYITFIPAVIFLVMEPYNKSAFVRFHAFQSIGLFVVWLIWFFVSLVLVFIPILGFLLSILVSLGFLVTWIITVLKASKGEWFKLPVIGDFAMKQAKP